MKESEIKGLEELKKQYESQLGQVPQYEKLANEFNEKAMDLVRQAVMNAGIKPEQTALQVKGGIMMRPSRCGFCTRCITDCVGCVAYA